MGETLSPGRWIAIVRRHGIRGVPRAAGARLSKTVRPFVQKVVWIFPALRVLARPEAAVDRRVLAIYDFRTYPYTVGEVLWFQELTLVLLEEHDADAVDVLWLCDPRRPASAGRGVTIENHPHKLAALLPLAQVNQRLGAFLLMDSAEEVEEYIASRGHRYVHIEPNFQLFAGTPNVHWTWYEKIVAFHERSGYLPRLSCAPGALLWARDFIGREIRPALPVVVQLRSNRSPVERSERRNAVVDAWVDFMTACSGTHDVTFIVIGSRDEIDDRVRALPNVIHSKDYGTTVEQDLALLQLSLMFLASTSGPGVMALFSGTPYRVFNYRPSHTRLPEGSQFPFAAPLQRLVWEPETAELLMREMEDIIGALDLVEWGRQFDDLARDAGAR